MEAPGQRLALGGIGSDGHWLGMAGKLVNTDRPGKFGGRAHPRSPAIRASRPMQPSLTQRDRRCDSTCASASADGAAPR
ncbi:hypothetical protein AI27_14225 [Sphingomonas sp. BHC-A]|nr:hypothetical protein AI27_14225 [Sphingomonas sp. BHC-A]